MKITVKKLADLHKPAHNIRRHSDKQITEYIRSIEMFGQIKPLVVDEHGEIIAGNGLFEALTRMGRETCDCYVVSGLADVQKKKLMMLERTIEAQKKYYKKTTLQDLDVEVAKLRAYLRLSHELGFLPMKKYEVWSGMAVEIGKMLGGWLKTIKSQPKT